MTPSQQLTRMEIEAQRSDMLLMVEETKPGTFYPIEPGKLLALCDTALAALSVVEAARKVALPKDAPVPFSFWHNIHALSGVLAAYDEARDG